MLLLLAPPLSQLQLVVMTRLEAIVQIRLRIWQHLELEPQALHAHMK